MQQLSMSIHLQFVQKMRWVEQSRILASFVSSPCFPWFHLKSMRVLFSCNMGAHSILNQCLVIINLNYYYYSLPGAHQWAHLSCVWFAVCKEPSIMQCSTWSFWCLWNTTIYLNWRTQLEIKWTNLMMSSLPWLMYWNILPRPCGAWRCRYTSFSLDNVILRAASVLLLSSEYWRHVSFLVSLRCERAIKEKRGHQNQQLQTLLLVIIIPIELPTRSMVQVQKCGC